MPSRISTPPPEFEELVPPRLRSFLVRHGLLRSALLTTGITLLLSLMATGLLLLVYRHYGVDTDEGQILTIALLSTLIIIFPVSLFAIDLFLRLHRMEERMRYLANYDTLTGLLGRRAFLQRAEERLTTSSPETPFALILLDLDNFKQINDRHGHAAGDAVLSHFGGLLRDLLPPEGLAGRMGGEEFALLLPRCDAPCARKFSARLHRSLAEHPPRYGETPLPYTVSAGLLLLDGSHPPEAIDPLLHQADIALYAAKRNGKAQTFLFDEGGALSRISL